MQWSNLHVRSVPLSLVRLNIPSSSKLGCLMLILFSPTAVVEIKKQKKLRVPQTRGSPTLTGEKPGVPGKKPVANPR